MSIWSRWFAKPPKARSLSSQVKTSLKAAYSERFGKERVIETQGMRVMSFEDEKGFDYEFYRDVQNQANAQKISEQWVEKARVEELTKLVETYRPKVTFGICHGTRSGKEQAWFKELLIGSPKVIGTDIADSATDFPDTVQWDFHEINQEWSGSADFVYSNSWDHAYDPQKAFGAWIDSLKQDGILLLDCSKGHLPEAVSAMDPSGATPDALSANLDNWFGQVGVVRQIVETGTLGTEIIKTVVFQKTSS